MDILQVLCLLFSLPTLILSRPNEDYWGQFGAYGPCSRTCGTGVAMRTRKCISSRTDGGHNCLGSSKSYRTCSTQACPAGTRDFREEQCSEMDRMDFQGKRHSWTAHYGATNPCELNCVPRGDNYFYRYKPAVVDGTRCYRGRSDICVDGICRLLIQGEFMGLDEDANSVRSTVSVAVAPQQRETVSYVYKTGVYNQCSVSCNGGMQYRNVECWAQDPMNPRVVEETYCITQRLQRPQSQQACNKQPCVAEFTVSSFSVCSVTCGEGQQMREVVCRGSGGERLPEQSCRGLVKPASVQACRRPACSLHVSWHVTDFGLCTRSCSGGVRERRVSCFDTDLTPYPDARCGTATRPVSVETCNSQPCPRQQTVPSVQDPRGQETIIRGFVPHVPEDPSASRPHVNPGYDAYPTEVEPDCTISHYGCCPDGHTEATGPRNQGCTRDDCVRSSFGCCLDGVTPAQGFGRVGCPEDRTSVQHRPPPPPPPPHPAPSAPRSPSTSSVCSLPRDDGPCDTWAVRYFYDSGTGRCTEFWFGGCHGNANNFVSMDACHRDCGAMVRETRPAPARVTPRRGGYQ